jgi:hypothetical protein
MTFPALLCFELYCAEPMAHVIAGLACACRPSSGPQSKSHSVSLNAASPADATLALLELELP